MGTVLMYVHDQIITPPQTHTHTHTKDMVITCITLLKSTWFRDTGIVHTLTTSASSSFFNSKIKEQGWKSLA